MLKVAEQEEDWSQLFKNKTKTHKPSSEQSDELRETNCFDFFNCAISHVPLMKEWL